MNENSKRKKLPSRSKRKKESVTSKKEKEDCTNDYSSSSSSLSDRPMPTVRGGYTHTKSSKRKIGNANKGKKPWNKGRQRSEADKAKISAGVRARNREALLKKLKAMGITEDEWIARKKQTKREREQERRRKAREKKLAEKALQEKDQNETKRKQELQEKKDKIRGILEKEKEASKTGIEILPDSEFSRNNNNKNKKTYEDTKDKKEDEEIDENEEIEEEIEEEMKNESQTSRLVFSREFIWKPHPFDSIPISTNTPLSTLEGASNINPDKKTCDSNEKIKSVSQSSTYSRKCASNGPGGLICCKQCTLTYSKYLSHTGKDIESQIVNKVGHEVNEILEILRGANTKLQRAVEVVKANDMTRKYLDTNATCVASSLKRNAATLNSSNFDLNLTSIMDICGS